MGTTRDRDTKPGLHVDVGIATSLPDEEEPTQGVSRR